MKLRFSKQILFVVLGIVLLFVIYANYSLYTEHILGVANNPIQEPLDATRTLQSAQPVQARQPTQPIVQPAPSIQDIKNATLNILRSTDTDANKLLRIMNTLVRGNENRKITIIDSIRNEAHRTNILDSAKLQNIRNLVSQ